MPSCAANGEGPAGERRAGRRGWAPVRLGLKRIKGMASGKPFILFLALLAIYTITLQTSHSDDCLPNMYLPLSMLKHGSVSLSAFPELYAAGRPYFLVPHDGGLYSIFGLGAALFALPFYLPFLFRGSTPSLVTLIYVSKLAASFYVALSAALLFAAMRRLTRERWALAISLVYALATAAFCTASQALWQHPPSMFLLSLAVYLLVRGEEEPRFAALAALPLGFSVLVRTTNLVFLAPILACLAWRKRRQLPAFLLLLLPGAAVTAWYNHVAYGSFLRFPLMAPKYLLSASEFSKYNESAGFWRTPFFTGLGGNLVSPSRGLLTTSPVLLVALVGFALLVWKRKELGRSLFALGTCFFFAFASELILVSKKTDWTGGLSFGNRLLLDTLPFLAVLFIPAFEAYAGIGKPAWKTLAKALFTALLCVSLLIQVEGVVSYDRGSWELGRSLEELAWSAGDSQFVFYARNPDPVVPPLLKRLTGKPPRLSSAGVDLLEGLPHLRFRLSELAALRWYVLPPGEGKVFLFETKGAKGRNDLVVVAESLSGREDGLDLEALKRLILDGADFEVMVIDITTGVSETHLID